MTLLSTISESILTDAADWSDEGDDLWYTSPSSSIAGVKEDMNGRKQCDAQSSRLIPRSRDEYPLSSPWTISLSTSRTCHLPGCDMPVRTGISNVASVNAGQEQSNNKPDREDVFYVLSEVQTVEAFWRFYNNIPAPGSLEPETDLHLFRAGIIPILDDVQNDGGGKWTIQLPQRKAKAKINQMWLFTPLAMIGEDFEGLKQRSSSGDNDGIVESVGLSALVNGVGISIRENFFLLALWIRAASDEFFDSPSGAAAIRRLGIQFKTFVLGYREDEEVNGVNIGYCSEVEFQRYKTGRSKKAMKKTRIAV